MMHIHNAIQLQVVKHSSPAMANRRQIAAKRLQVNTG